MEADSPPNQQPGEDALAKSAAALSTAAAKLTRQSRAIPTGRDFHFYHNFPDFKAQIKTLASTSHSSLESISSSSSNFSGLNEHRQPPSPSPDEDLEDWLVSLNDDLLERFGASMDEFKALREKSEGKGEKIEGVDGFQVVYGKKKKKGDEDFISNISDSSVLTSSVKVAAKEKEKKKAKVPFHIPTIPRPQSVYSIIVDNANQQFKHVWLDKSEDGISMLQKVSVDQFIDRKVSESEPVKPLALEDTPFKLVEDVRALKELASKLMRVNEFAVDLEHNSYRSFQGLTCLMQISTRSEDFVVDTLKLRIFIGSYLREVFKDPTKRKVMHGADHDIVWLQRDFGIYVCNLFDTGQASRVLQMERNSLEYLLHYFCEVNANKEYQNADWRLRPLPDEMVKYAREDTHYLLYIYDLMKDRLLSESTDENDRLAEVFQRSHELCLQLYEKELLTDTSYLYIYGLQEAELSSQQLAIVAGLYQWRDSVARAEDESTGYILPNKALIDIAKQMPQTTGKLRRLVRSKHPFVERHLSSVTSIICNSIENSAAFESMAEQLKKGRLEGVTRVESINSIVHDSQMIPSVNGEDTSKIDENAQSVAASEAVVKISAPSATGHVTYETSMISNIQLDDKPVTISASESKSSLTISELSRTVDKKGPNNGSQQTVTKATVQVMKRPAAFGALFGSSASTRKSQLLKGFSSGQADSKDKVEMIKSSVTLPFHYFSGGEKPPTPSGADLEMPRPEPESIQNENEEPPSTSMEEVIELDDQMDDDADDTEQPNDMPGSPSELSSGFEKCFQSLNEIRNSQPNRNAHQEPDFNFDLKPFDYAAARKNIKFGKLEADKNNDDDGTANIKDSRDRRSRNRAFGEPFGGENEGSSQSVRRRQAFPPSGNRSTTYH